MAAITAGMVKELRDKTGAGMMDCKAALSATDGNMEAAIDWLREPSRLWLRVGAAILFILGGIFAILPVLGLWMLPVGLALLAQDVPGLKVPLERSARWIEATWAKLKARWRG